MNQALVQPVRISCGESFLPPLITSHKPYHKHFIRLIIAIECLCFYDLSLTMQVIELSSLQCSILVP